jgi:hypothetical protein
MLGYGGRLQSNSGDVANDYSGVGDGCYRIVSATGAGYHFDSIAIVTVYHANYSVKAFGHFEFGKCVETETMCLIGRRDREL